MAVALTETICMTGTLFVDSNVFVYSRDSREPEKMVRARQWLEYLWREQLGRTSVQVLTEYYNAMTRKTKPAVTALMAWDSVSPLFVWNPLPVDRPLLERGRAVEERFELSWWDSRVVAAAQLQACAVLLTEDLQHGCTYGTVTVLNPFKAGVAEARATLRVRTRGRSTLPSAGTTEARGLISGAKAPAAWSTPPCR
jgi:predicted nucleic acid-binding protein